MLRAEDFTVSGRIEGDAALASVKVTHPVCAAPQVFAASAGSSATLVNLAGHPTGCVGASNPGEVALEATARDGRKVTNVLRVTFDFQAPVISSAVLATTSDGFTMTVTATDDIGLYSANIKTPASTVGIHLFEPIGDGTVWIFRAVGVPPQKAGASVTVTDRASRVSGAVVLQ